MIQREKLSLEHGTLILIADTHSRPHAEAARLAAAHRPDAILHAGDIGDHAAMDPFREVAPLFMVRGNIDGRDPSTPDTIVLDVECGDVPTPLRILMTHIAVSGPKLRRDVAARAKREGAGLVVCGHSHVPFIAEDQGLWVFNPGSIGPRRFQLPITMGVLEWSTSAKGLSLKHVDCETGSPWRP